MYKKTFSKTKRKRANGTNNGYLGGDLTSKEKRKRNKVVVCAGRVSTGRYQRKH